MSLKNGILNIAVKPAKFPEAIREISQSQCPKAFSLSIGSQVRTISPPQHHSGLINGIHANLMFSSR